MRDSGMSHWKRYTASTPDGEKQPLQIFLTGPAGCGKTSTMKLLMETRTIDLHGPTTWLSTPTASTGTAAAAINGTTVHAAFRIGNSPRATGLSVEVLNSFRTAFNNVRIVFVDECSMIGWTTVRRYGYGVLWRSRAVATRMPDANIQTKYTKLL